MRRGLTVETEREFVQVVVQMLKADRALVSAQKLSFHQRGDTVDARHKFVHLATAPFNVADPVSVSGVAAQFLLSTFQLTPRKLYPHPVPLPPPQAQSSCLTPA